MSCYAGPNTESEGLILHLDAKSTSKCFPRINYCAGQITGNSNVPVTTVTDILPDGTTGTVYESTAILVEGNINRTGSMNPSQNLQKNKTYTVSWYIKNINCTGFGGNVYDSTLATVLTGIANYTSKVTTNSWTRIQQSFTIPNSGADTHSIWIQYFRDAGVGTWRTCWAQVEEGPFATPYMGSLGSRKGVGYDSSPDWIDISSNTYSVSVLNGLSYDNESFLFDGVNDRIDCGTYFPNVINGTNNFSIDCWVYPKSSQATNADIWGNHTEPYSGIVLQQAGGEQNYYTWGFGCGTFWGANSGKFHLKENAWCNLVAIRNGSALLVYIDGKFIISGTEPAALVPNTTFNFQIGTGYNLYSSRYWKGSISSFKIYNRALSASEIRQNFNATRGRFGI